MRASHFPTSFRMTPLSLVVILLLTSTSRAITYGVADGNQHPNVGALVGTFQGQTFPYCSGTLISPTVFLTAAHCDLGTSTVFVTFDSVFSSKSKLYAGTYYSDPLFNQAQNDTHDIAVVVFDKPFRGLVPAQLPSLRQFDDLPHDQQFTAVGYGGEERVHQPGSGSPVIGFLDIRQYATSTLNATNPAWLRLSQNPATGDGGTCFGDSGGPNFLGSDDSETNIIGGITITGDSVCRATNVIYRVDTESARAFLGNFVPLP